MNLVLSSDFPSTANQGLVDHIREAGRNPRIAWLAPAASTAESHFPAARTAFAALGFNDLEYLNADTDPSRPAVVLLDRYDVVYLTGGDPLIFRQNLRRSGLATRLREFAAAGGLIVGASSGAMQLTRNLSLFRLPSNSLEEVMSNRGEFDGLGLVDFEVLPHLNRHSAAILERVREYSELVTHEIVALRDGAAIVFDNPSDYRCFGNGLRIHRGVMEALVATHR